MSNNHLLNKNLNNQIVANIFSSLITGEKWEMLLEMFKLKILDINARDYRGRNALYWAINKNKIEIIKKLISLNISTEVSPNLSALNYAVYLDNTKVLRCLKNCGLDINEFDDINSTALIYAILYNKQNSINFLVQNGANIEHEDFLGNSALNLSCNSSINILLKEIKK